MKLKNLLVILFTLAFASIAQAYNVNGTYTRSYRDSEYWIQLSGGRFTSNASCIFQTRVSGGGYFAYYTVETLCTMHLWSYAPELYFRYWGSYSCNGSNVYLYLDDYSYPGNMISWNGGSLISQYLLNWGIDDEGDQYLSFDNLYFWKTSSSSASSSRSKSSSKKKKSSKSKSKSKSKRKK